MKSKIYYIILSILLSLTSCNSWLDVTPQGQLTCFRLKKGITLRSGVYTTRCQVHPCMVKSCLMG